MVLYIISWVFYVTSHIVCVQPRIKHTRRFRLESIRSSFRLLFACREWGQPNPLRHHVGKLWSIVKCCHVLSLHINHMFDDIWGLILKVPAWEETICRNLWSMRGLDTSDCGVGACRGRAVSWRHPKWKCTKLYVHKSHGFLAAQAGKSKWNDGTIWFVP